MSLLTMNSKLQRPIPMIHRKNIQAVCCEDNYFTEGKFKLIDTSFHSVYPVFSIRLFSIANLSVVRYMWDVCNEDKCCVVTHRAAVACLRSQVVCAYCNFESKQAISITLFQFRRRPNN